jgi:hypothetical protein
MTARTRPERRILDLWMRCYTQEEIGEVRGAER